MSKEPKVPTVKAEIDNAAWVRTANRLLHKQWRLNNTQQRLLYIVASQVKISDAEFHEYEFKTRDLLEALGQKWKDQSSVRWLISLMKTMVRDVQEFEVDDGITIAAWFIRGKYERKGDGIIKLMLAPELVPYYVNLIEQGSFTKQSLGIALALRGDVSIKLHALLMEKAFTADKSGWWSIEMMLKEVRYQFGLEDKYLDSSGPTNIKIRVITPAVEELNEKTELEVLCYKIEGKRSGSIAGFKFTAHRKKKGQRVAVSQAEINEEDTSLEYEKVRNNLKGKKLKEFDIEWDAIQKQKFMETKGVPASMLKTSAEQGLLKKYMPAKRNEGGA